MNLLDRHIARAILAGTLATLLVLLSLIAFVSLVDEMGDVGTGRYQVSDALIFILFSMPKLAYEVFPVSAFMGGLLGLGMLANNGELVAMRAAGISLARIVAAALKIGCIMILAAVFIGEWIAPESQQAAQRRRGEALSEQVTLKTQHGFWTRDGKSFVNIREILPGSQLADIFIYEFTEQRELTKATHARFADYQDRAWLLRDIRQSRFEQHGVDVKALETETWASLLDPEILKVVVVEPSALPVWGLYRYIRFLRDNGQDPQIYEVAFWGKVTNPLATFVMLYLAVPFVFGSLRTIDIGQRIFTGALVGISFFLSDKALSNLAVVYELNPLFAAAFPSVVFFVLALWLVRRVH